MDTDKAKTRIADGIGTNTPPSLSPVYKRAVGRWQHYQKFLEPHLEKLEPFVKAFGYG
jgi:hypothetical protein